MRCIICRKHTKLCCSKCNEVHYCSKKHQIEHWRCGHRENCLSQEDRRKACKVCLIRTTILNTLLLQNKAQCYRLFRFKKHDCGEHVKWNAWLIIRIIHVARTPVLAELIITLMLRHGWNCNENVQDGVSPLSCMITKGNYILAETLIASGKVDLTIPVSNGLSLLHVPEVFSIHKLVTLAFKHAKISQLTTCLRLGDHRLWRCTPVWNAVTRGSADVIEALWERCEIDMHGINTKIFTNSCPVCRSESPLQYLAILSNASWIVPLKYGNTVNDYCSRLVAAEVYLQTLAASFATLGQKLLLPCLVPLVQSFLFNQQSEKARQSFALSLLPQSFSQAFR